MKQKLLLGAAALLASAGAHGTQTWSIDVQNATTATLQCPAGSTADTCLSPTGKTNAFDNQATITITCATAAVCQNVTLNLLTDRSVLPGGTAPTTTTKLYTLSNSNVTGSTNVAVFHQGVQIANTAFTLAPSGAPTPTPQGHSSGTARTLEQVVASSNPIQLSDCQGRGSYSDRNGDGEERATAEVYVDVLGNVLSKPAESFDENDRLNVYVLGDPDLLQRLKVARTSDARDVTAVRIIGQGVTPPSIEQKQALTAPTCKMRLFEGIDSFAPGKGVVTISRVNGNAVEPIGTFDVNVAPLYSGIFTLGAARTEAVDPKFKLVANGADQVIAPGDASEKDTVYSIFYTPFILGKRDLEKPFRLDKWYRHINPTIGLVLDDVSNNFMAGISIDLPRGIVITAGRHYRKVTVLSEESGLTVGSVFTGAPETIPTSKSWESEKFIAVSVDLRVMAQLIKSAFTTATN